jgi:hypothetical protein
MTLCQVVVVNSAIVGSTPGSRDVGSWVVLGLWREKLLS